MKRLRAATAFPRDVPEVPLRRRRTRSRGGSGLRAVTPAAPLPAPTPLPRSAPPKGEAVEDLLIDLRLITLEDRVVTAARSPLRLYLT